MGSREVLSPALKVLIVGAGIAGLAAAISCRRAGHDVTVYERSALNNEVGAAIHVCPNASRGLLAWGFDPTKARFVTSKSTYRAFGTNLKRFYEIDAGHIEETFGAPWYFAHRVDLHEELKRIATQVEGEGKPVEVCLRAEVAKFVRSLLSRDGRVEKHSDLKITRTQKGPLP
jgi:salicylate hydroxylase